MDEYYIDIRGHKHKKIKTQQFYKEYDEWKKTSEYKKLPKFSIISYRYRNSYSGYRWVDTKIYTPDKEFEMIFFKKYIRNGKI